MGKVGVGVFGRRPAKGWVDAEASRSQERETAARPEGEPDAEPLSLAEQSIRESIKWAAQRTDALPPTKQPFRVRTR